MAYFDELMQRAITVRNNVAPSSNTALLVGGVLVSIVSALQLLLDTKQGTLTFDDEPTDGSTNPVTSDGIYEAIADAIASIDLSACEKIVNKVTALSAQSTDTQYPSAKCVYDALQAIDLSACEKIINKVTSLSAQSTDTQYPSAKCVYDALQAIDLSACEKIVNKVTSLSAQSTDTQYPSAKCVYDALQAIDLSVYELLANKVTSLSAQSTDVQYPSAKCVYDALQAIDLSACEKIVNKVTSLSAQSTDVQYPSAKCVYDAIQAINLSAYELIANKVTSINAQSTDVQYPTAKLLYDSLQALSGIYAAIQHTHAIADIINLQTELNARQLVSNLVTAITAQSTDQQYPSAKLLYDQLQGLAAVYAPKVHTHPFADIERPANVASVNAQGYTITTAYYSHVLTITADATLHLPTMQSGAAIILRLTIIQDATGGRAVTFDGGAALVFNPYQTDLSLGQANYRCWVVLWFDGVNWAWLASPYVLRAESQFAYTIDGTTGGQYVTVTINGTTMQIQATSGVWQYGYNNPINSIAFTGDTGVLNVDFTNSDGLANITTLADAFKNCAALVAVDFTGCDLSNVATAADCFAGCTSLAALTIPTGTWKPDIDLSACAAFTKAAMLAVIDGLYTYASGTHTVTFNSTAWNALSVADQQVVSDAADAKGWTTNAVAVVYVIRGTSTNVGGSETFNIQFIQDGAQSPGHSESVIVNVDGNGQFEYSYQNQRIYGLSITDRQHFISLEFTEDMAEFVNGQSVFSNFANLQSLSFPNGNFNKCTNGTTMFSANPKLTTLDLSKAVFPILNGARNMFVDNVLLTTLDLGNATFALLTETYRMFFGLKALTSLNLSAAIFGEVTNAYGMFNQNSNHPLQTLSLPEATFAKVTNAFGMFLSDGLVTLNMPKATLASVTETSYMLSDLKNLTTINVPTGTIPKTFGFTRSNSGIALTYQSMVNVANWCKDLTGGTAQSVTFNTTAWNALTAAEQSNIDTILSGKNWTRVLA